jgi:hypothetical protein
MCRSSPGVGILIALCRLPIPLRSSPAIGSSDLPVDGALQSFLDEAELTDQESFDDERFPNVLIAGDGTVVATWGSQDLRVRRSEDGGATWGPENPVGAPRWGVDRGRFGAPLGRRSPGRRVPAGPSGHHRSRPGIRRLDPGVPGDPAPGPGRPRPALGQLASRADSRRGQGQ